MKTLATATLTLALVGSATCGPKPTENGKPEATVSEDVPALVNGLPVTREAFERRLDWALRVDREKAQRHGRAAPPARGTMGPDGKLVPYLQYWRRVTIQELVNEEIVVQEAGREGISVFSDELDEEIAAVQERGALRLAGCPGEDPQAGADSARDSFFAGLDDDTLRTAVERALLGQRMRLEVECGVDLTDAELELAFRGRHEWVELDYVVIRNRELSWEAVVPRLVARETTLAKEARDAKLQVHTARVRPTAEEIWGIRDPDLVANATELSADAPVLYLHGGMPQVGGKVYLAVFRSRREANWNRLELEKEEIRAKALTVKRARAWLEWRRSARRRATVTLHESVQ